ncbi:MAG: ACT domain-containing protein, partial [Caldilineaceae bacterium]|nr:ACT domain-containing protein [Caldilineaceae bacterium]
MHQSNEVTLINVTGRDHPGLLARITDVLAESEVNILDIGQAVIHEHISLGLLVELSARQPSAGVMKELLYTAHQEGVQV